MDLDQRTLSSLDWPYVLDALASRARTSAGRRAASELEPSSDRARIAELHDEVDDAFAVRADGAASPPMAGISEIAGEVARAARGEGLDLDEVRAVAETVVALEGVARFFAPRASTAPTLARRAGAIEMDAGLVGDLGRAFDDRGGLSEKTYPQLGDLRRRIEALERRVRETLERLVSGPELSDVLQDRFVTVRDDRFVVPVRAQAKSTGIGIVHDTSRSGQTVYLEPSEVVPLNNERRMAEAALAAEERRILAQLSAAIGRDSDAILAAQAAAIDIDVAWARFELARRLDATRPEVGDGGCIRLRAARHPVLALGGIDVVANDLSVDAAQPLLVLTGPNAGGKTVALKTVALAALLTRIGCFVPAQAGSRIDVFPVVLADIGDSQSVHGGLSSFSGHLATLRIMLERAGEGALLLLDELAAGTDPAQGGALARALLERFADLGARVVATTHYAQVKGMAAADPRVCMAAMEYRDERPTYRVVSGVAGESHGLATALHAGIDADVVARAHALMDEGERALHDALAALEAERARSAALAEEAERTAAKLARREQSLAQRETRIKVRGKEMEQAVAAEFIERVKVAEREIARITAELQRDPSTRKAATAREEVAKLGGLRPDDEAPAARSAARLAAGDRVRVARLGLTGEVVSTGERGVEVRAGSVTVRVKPEELEMVGGADGSGRARGGRRGERKASATPAVSVETAVRVDGNTCDLRGERVSDGLVKLERYLDDAILRGHDAVFVLHGHGTGAMKKAVRELLSSSSYVAGFGAAPEDHGGDAFTVAVLRG